MLYVIAYDIDSDDVRGKVAAYLTKRGTRLQKSVFAADIDRHDFKRLLKELADLAEGHGDVMVIPLCSGCRRRTYRLQPSERPFYVF